MVDVPCILAAATLNVYVSPLVTVTFYSTVILEVVTKL